MLSRIIGGFRNSSRLINTNCRFLTQLEKKDNHSRSGAPTTCPLSSFGLSFSVRS